jgi:hypothetical protein
MKNLESRKKENRQKPVRIYFPAGFFLKIFTDI